MVKKNIAKNAIKNSTYNFIATIIAKVGSLLLTIILARMLLPKMFGIYSLVLSIVLIVFTFTDLGVNSATYRYLSFALKDNNLMRARSYFRYLLKIRCILILFAILIMLILAPILAYNIYDKPIILLPLIFATIYISINSFRSVFEGLYFPTKDLKNYPLTTFILHGLRVFLAGIVLLIISRELAIIGLFLAFAVASLISIFFVLIALGKRRNIIFGKTKKIEYLKINKYLGFMSIASISLVIFGSVDTLMLGYFVDSEFIGYYRAALGLIVSITAIFSLSNILLPLFTQIERIKLNNAFKKVSEYILIITIPATLGLLIVGGYIIKVIYGIEYSLAKLPLYVLSLLIFITPMTKLYSSLFESREKTKIIARAVLISLTLNIILNYFLIKTFLSLSQEMAITGAALATIISQIFYFSLLIIPAKKEFKIPFPLNNLTKPLFASMIMMTVLLFYNRYIYINLFTGVIEIFLGVIIYFLTLSLIRGLDKRDIKILRKTFRK